MTTHHMSQGRAVGVTLLVCLASLVAIIAPILLVQIAGIDQGFILLIVGIAQLGLTLLVLRGGLSKLGRSFKSLGWTTSTNAWIQDLFLALLFTVPRLFLEFGVFIPQAGDLENSGVQEVLYLVQGGAFAMTWAVSYSLLGAIAEEWFFRGFLLTAIPDRFRSQTLGLIIASIISIGLFALLHFPPTLMDWLSFLVGGAIYTGLFIYTRRVTTPILAHVLWNIAALIAVLVLYS